MTGHGRSRRCYRDRAARPVCESCGTRVPCEDCRRTNREQRAKERGTVHYPPVDATAYERFRAALKGA